MNALERLEAWLKSKENRMMDEVVWDGDEFHVYLQYSWEVGFQGRGKTLAEAIDKALEAAKESGL